MSAKILFPAGFAREIICASLTSFTVFGYNVNDVRSGVSGEILVDRVAGEKDVSKSSNIGLSFAKEVLASDEKNKVKIKLIV